MMLISLSYSTAIRRFLEGSSQWRVPRWLCLKKGTQKSSTCGNWSDVKLEMSKESSEQCAFCAGDMTRWTTCHLFNCNCQRKCITLFSLGPLHTWVKSRDHEIVRAQKQVSKGCPTTPPKACSVVTDPKSIYTLPLRASPPLQGLGKPFDTALEKNMPHPSPIPLFKLSVPLTILAGERCSLMRPHSGFFLGSATCVKGTWNIPDTFSIWRERKQLTVGECRGKKFGCKLVALQRAFPEFAFLRQGGDALSVEAICDWALNKMLLQWIFFSCGSSYMMK